MWHLYIKKSFPSEINKIVGVLSMPLIIIIIRRNSIQNEIEIKIMHLKIKWYPRGFLIKNKKKNEQNENGNIKYT